MSVATTKDHAATFKCWLGGLTEEERQRFEPLGYWAGDDGVVVFEHRTAGSPSR